MITKFRKTLTNEQRFQRMLDKHPGEDPITPIFMHSLERYLKGLKDHSGTDTIVEKTLHKYPKIKKDVLLSLVEHWHTIPQNLKKSFVPKELSRLDITKKLEDKDLVKILSRFNKKQMKRNDFFTGLRISGEDLKKINAGSFPLSNDIKINSITPSDPDGFPLVYIGGTMTVNGTGFSLINTDNLVIIKKIENDIFQDAEFGLYPSASTKTQLIVKLPNEEEMQEGMYAVLIQVKNKGLSSLQRAQFLKPQVEGAHISGITPAIQVPGLPVLINGERFRQQPRVFWKAFEPGLEAGEMAGLIIEWLNNGQLKMTIPDRFVYFPGKYLIAVSGDHQGLSNWHEFTVKPLSYKLEFTTIKCLDESDPEFVGNDEIVTRWAIACDMNAWAKQSSEYTGFSDGTVKAFTDTDKTVFQPSGMCGEVKKELVVGIWPLEWDEGDAKAASEILDYAADVAGKIKQYEWTKYIFKFLSKIIVWLGGDPDSLGEKTLVWSAAELRDKTNNPEHKYSNSLFFNNDDETGSYQLSYTLRRSDN